MTAFRDLPVGSVFRMTDVLGKPGSSVWVKVSDTGAVGRDFDRSQAIHPEADVLPVETADEFVRSMGAA